jgi:methanogenic corrinoid protein MtbC1
VIFSHDDWGTKDALFMKPDMWREFFKEPYRRFYGYIRDRGVIAIHHADSYLSPIVEDMAEIGIQVWQGVLPENNIPELQKRLKGRMVLMGGIGAAIDRADTEEEEARTYVHDALHEYCPGGHFIPSITYGIAGTVYKHVDPWIDDEIRKYNEGVHLPRYGAPVSGRLNPVKLSPAGEDPDKASKTVSAAAPVYGTGILDEISEALQDGSVSETVDAVNAALDQGFDAQTILTDGLVRGMNELGEDFSLGEVFVPEMLRAANCMSAATDILKPLLAGGNGGGASGRVCLGTVRGDLHDIGKNLVKIMMEGSGLEVIDLGCDVCAEDFIQSAMDNKCDIIACSTLLTTSMGEIKRVVDLANESGIRDKVKILIGGAPVTQEYCEQVGADMYTTDAAAAARAAVQMMEV